MFGDDPVVDAMLESSIAASTATVLLDSPQVDPLPAQMVIVREAARWGVGLGLRLPPRIFYRFVVPNQPDRVARGAAMRQGDTFRIILNANLLPDALREVTFHELMHINDYFSGQAFSPLELEKRAIAFAADAIARWARR